MKKNPSSYLQFMGYTGYKINPEDSASGFFSDRYSLDSLDR